MPRQSVIATVRALENQYGQVDPELYVEKAGDPTSPLHDTLTWDNEAASHKYRLTQAGAILRSIKYEVTIGEKVLRTVLYLHDERVDAGESMYVNIEHVTEDYQIDLTIAREVDRVLGIFERGRGVAFALNREQEFIDAVKARVFG